METINKLKDDSRLARIYKSYHKNQYSYYNELVFFLEKEIELLGGEIPVLEVSLENLSEEQREEIQDFIAGYTTDWEIKNEK